MKNLRQHLKKEATKTWQAHRLEGKVKNRGIKKVKKPGRLPLQKGLR